MHDEATLVTYGRAAAMLDVSRVTVSDLVRKYKLVPKAMSNGRAKGLDHLDLKTLQKALNERGRLLKA